MDAIITDSAIQEGEEGFEDDIEEEGEEAEEMGPETGEDK